MDHFDTATMTYLATQMGQPSIPTSDPFQDMLLPMEMPDQHSNYAFAGYGSAIPRQNAMEC